MSKREGNKFGKISNLGKVLITKKGNLPRKDSPIREGLDSWKMFLLWKESNLEKVLMERLAISHQLGKLFLIRKAFLYWEWINNFG